jgi:DNA-binding response OmpR family regulator
MTIPNQPPAPKCVSTLELIIHVYHDKEDGSDISVDEVVKQLKQAIEDIKEAGTHKAWMETIYTEET